MVELPIEHGLHVVRVLPQFGLHQDKFPIGFGPGARVLRINDDRTEHTAANVLDHRRCAAVIEEHAGLLGHEGILDRLAWSDFAVVLQEVEFCRVKVHRMALGVRGGVDEGEVHGIAFGDPNDRAWHLTIKGPGFILRTGTVNDDFRFGRRECDIMDLCSCGPGHRDTPAGSQQDAKPEG